MRLKYKDQTGRITRIDRDTEQVQNLYVFGRTTDSKGTNSPEIFCKLALLTIDMKGL